MSYLPRETFVEITLNIQLELDVRIKLKITLLQLSAHNNLQTSKGE